MTASITRRFLGWDRPVLDLLVEELTRDSAGEPLDLQSLHLIVPTAQAGRRLREKLAIRAGQTETGYLSGPMDTPGSLLRPRAASRPVATRPECLAVWSVALLQAKPTDHDTLFPASGRIRDSRWALAAARQLMALRHSLAENGLDMRSVLHAHAGFGETARWEDLARIEDAYLLHLDSIGLEDPDQARRRAAEEIRPGPGVRKILIAAVPDPIPLALQALETLSLHVPVEVLVHAPESEAAFFDSWGRPLPQRWATRTIPFRDQDIHLAGNPAELADLALSIAAGTRSASSGTALVVGNSDTIPFLEAGLHRLGIPAWNPAGRSARTHPLISLATILCGLARNRTMDDLDSLFHHPDSLAYLAHAQSGVSSSKLLQLLAEQRRTHLPESIDDLCGRGLAQTSGEDQVPGVSWKRTLGRVREMLDMLSGHPLHESVPDLLRRVHELHPPLHGAQESDFAAAADALRQLADDFRRIPQLSLELKQGLLDELFADELDRLRYQPEGTPDSMALEGWLEFHWNDAPEAVVLGMNEGDIPESVVGDVFLPDSARQTLGLACNSTRYARDACILTAALQSRNNSGVHAIVARTTMTGDPKRPTRLLLACSDNHLPQRTLRLFGQSSTQRPRPPRSASWKIRPPWFPLPGRLPVTALKDYLTCPFRFYLKHVLKMRAVESRPLELDPAGFGALCHHALERLVIERALAGVTDPDGLSGHLDDAASQWMAQRFGTDLSAPLAVQLEAARQRLSYAARIEADQRQQGWTTIHAEYRLGRAKKLRIGSIELVGRADRIDRGPAEEVRVLDYKTSDTARSPEDAHCGPRRVETADYACIELAGKERAFTDLQLPLYSIMAASDFNAPVTSGYFNLPKAVGETGIRLWEELDDSLLSAAMDCATGIIRAIERYDFWPPGPDPDWDDFAPLFPGGIREHVDEQWMMDLRNALEARHE